MITKEQLNTVATTQDDINFFFGGWDFQYNLKTNELWNINDGYGKPEFLCVVTDFEQLTELIELLTT